MPSSDTASWKPTMPSCKSRSPRPRWPRRCGKCWTQSSRTELTESRPSGSGEPGMKEKAIVSWSGGKDSALALFETQTDWDIVALLTTVTECYDRTSMHGVRTSLMKQQAHSLRYALDTVNISAIC